MPDEPRAEFHEQLEELERETLATADLCIVMLDQAIDAVVNRDSELARMVIDGDDRIDGRYLDVHQGLLSLLARQSPVATDLRLVAAILDTIMHIERIGDLCVNIAKMVPLMSKRPDNDPGIIARIEAAANQARDQIRQAQQCFAERNVEMAIDLCVQDDTIDRLNREVFNVSIELGGEDVETREWASLMMLIARYIERIGDHTVDIGEQIAFVITGEFREFTDASRPGEVPTT